MRTPFLIIAFVFALIAIGSLGFMAYSDPRAITPPPSGAATSTPPTGEPASTIMSTTTTPGMLPEPQQVSFRVLDTGTHAANVSTRKNVAVYTEAEFIKLWTMPNVALPYIDFSKEYVIAVFAGQKPTGGHAIAVTSIRDSGNMRTLAVTLTSPGDGCMVTQSLTNPFQIIAVPISSATLSHKDLEVAKACE